MRPPRLLRPLRCRILASRANCSNSEKYALLAVVREASGDENLQGTDPEFLFPCYLQRFGINPCFHVAQPTSFQMFEIMLQF
jgi:hypothetical protein